MVANAATAPTVQLGEEFKSVAALDGKTFAIVNQAEEKALFGPNNQNLGYDEYAKAFSSSNSGFAWKIESLAGNADESIRSYYLIRLVKPDGSVFADDDWGGRYLNSQSTTGWCCFNLGLTGKKMGQDIDNGAVWEIQYVEGQGFSLKNIGTGLYKGFGTGTANAEEAAYWSFKQVIVDYSAAVAEVLAEAEPYKALVTDQKALDAFADAVKNLTSETAKSSEDLEKAKAAVAALIKAQTADGANMTGAIVNPSFELGTANGWTYAASQDHGAKENGNPTYTMSNNDGKYVFNIWPQGNAISQTIEGLPNGTYKLQAVIATDGGKKVQLNANDKNVQIDATGKETGVEGEVEFEVTDGKATIGVEGVDESWYKVDNFRLTLVKAAAVVPEKDAWYNQINFAAKDYADPNATYTDGVDFPDAPWAVDGEGNGAIKIVSNAKKSQSHESQFFMQIADLAGGKFNKNDKVILKYKAKAESSNADLKEIQAGGGFHGNYAGNQWKSGATGATIKVGEWTDITTELTITNTDVTNYSLDLTYDAAPITYYFDDFSFEYVKGKDDWYNNNVVVAKDPAVEYEDGKSYEFPAAPYVYDAKGNGYAEVKTMANPTKEWASQIFFTIPENLAGKQVAISMKVKASKAVTAKAQRHQDNTGSTYMDNYPDANIDFTTEWNKVSVIVDTKKENGEAVDIAKCFVLNLAVDAEALTFDFDSLKFEQYFAPVDYGELIEIPLEGTVVMERDFTKETSYTHSPNWANNKDGYTDKLIVGEGLEIVNTADQGMWDSQFFIMEGFNLVGGRDYAVRYTLKYEGDGGDMQINMGDWTNNDQGVETLAAGPIYTQMVRLFPSFKGDATGAHVFFQSGAIKGRMIVEKVEVIDVTPKYDEMDWSENILKNGDLSGDDMSAFILKNNDVENPEMLLAEKSAIGDGFEIGIETAARPTNEDGSVGGNDHDAQFFVRLPYVLPKGKKFNLEFDLYAEKINTLAIQAHGEPGQFKENLSSVTTNPAGNGIVHYQKYLSAPADMRSIAFNLAVADATTYGFSNIKVQIVNDDKATIEEATATADATTLWAETLALNEACYAGRIAETEGCTEASVKALTDAIAAGKAALADPAPTKESLTAAAQAITDAIAGLKKDAPALAYTDLTKEMFFHWNAADKTAEALEASNCDYNIGTSTGQVYGLSTVNHDRFADLSAYNTIELKATEGEPRLLFNRIEDNGTVFVELPRDKDKYETIVDNGDGSKTYIIDIAAIVAEHGFAHLHAIKGANWVNTTVTEIKLGYVGEKPALPIPVAINGIAEGASVKDGKYFVNGQIVIVKGGKKFNAAGVEIK